MPRANRYFIPGCVWHITHRCHKKEFLLKFSRDRQRWVSWLFEAKRRYGLSVLNYVVTSNHIHLLVEDTGKSVISRSIQLIAGRTAQEFNTRKRRKGAFWEDRYHATAVESNEHLLKCIAYIDLNMVRCGVVNHPSEWMQGGYREIQSPPVRYRIINIPSLVKLCGIGNIADLQRHLYQLIAQALENGISQREAYWTEAIAVGNESFIDTLKASLGIKAIHRKVVKRDNTLLIEETPASYTSFFYSKIDHLSLENTLEWDVF